MKKKIIKKHTRKFYYNVFFCSIFPFLWATPRGLPLQVFFFSISLLFSATIGKLGQYYLTRQSALCPGKSLILLNSLCPKKMAPVNLVGVVPRSTCSTPGSASLRHEKHSPFSTSLPAKLIALLEEYTCHCFQKEKTKANQEEENFFSFCY